MGKQVNGRTDQNAPGQAISKTNAQTNHFSEKSGMTKMEYLQKFRLKKWGETDRELEENSVRKTDGNSKKLASRG
jgi:hypothetical protein